MLEALEGSALASWLRYSTIAYPLVSAAHVLAVGGLVTTAALIDLRLLGRLTRLPSGVVADTLVPAAAVAFAGAAATGVLLFSVSAGDYVANPAFRWKMALLVGAIANVALVHGGRAWRRFRTHGARGPTLAAHAIASFFSWLAVLVAGRFIGFV